MSIYQLIQTYRTELENFFKKIPHDQLEKCFQLFADNKGFIFFSGVGKSALVAQKMAVTLTATGSRALFLSPLEAMHGDVGLVSDNDLFVAISNSGETEELLNLLPFVRNKKAKIIAITAKAQSKLAKAADQAIIVPVERELCPFNLAPTISTTAQGIIGDILAIALMEKKQFSLDEYAKNHPSGSIGKRLTVRVKDLMLKGDHIPLAAPDDRLVDTLVELSDKKAGCVIIVDKNRTMLGIFTDGDLRRALQKKGEHVLSSPMRELMTLSGRITHPDILAWDAMREMEGDQKHPVMVLPVVDDNNRVIGLIKMHDILQSGL